MDPDPLDDPLDSPDPIVRMEAEIDSLQQSRIAMHFLLLFLLFQEPLERWLTPSDPSPWGGVITAVFFGAWIVSDVRAYRRRRLVRRG